MKKNAILKLVIFFIFSTLLYSCQGQAENPEANSTKNITPTSTTAKSQTPEAISSKTKNFIQLAWFYKPPIGGQINLLADNFDFFILTHKDEETRDQLKSMGADDPILQYLLFAEIRQPDTCDSDNYGNQIAYKNGDFCLIRNQHPDWFLMDKAGNPIHNNNRMYYMDPGNPEYRIFWFQRMIEMQTEFGWEGIFIDNIEASLAKFDRMGSTPAKYPDDASYKSAVNGFILFVKESIQQTNKIPLMGNIVSTRDDEVWLQYIENLDGAMIESFAVDWSNGYKSAANWERQMEEIEKALVQNKFLILVSQSEQYDDIRREQFALASYLLVSKRESTAFRYVNSEDYQEIWLYENLSLDPGLPLGPRYHDGFAWRRDFTNGYVLVNPWTHSSQLNFSP